MQREELLVAPLLIKEDFMDAATLKAVMGDRPDVDYAAYTEPFSYAPEELRGFSMPEGGYTW